MNKMKRNSLKCLFVACALSLSAFVNAQTASDLRINEVTVERDSLGNVTEAWIEVFNPTYSSVYMARLFLSNDRCNLSLSLVPEGTTDTQFMPRGYVVIDGDGQRSQGPMHTTFPLGDSEYVYLIESNGVIVIDSCMVPQNGTIARSIDGAGEWITPKDKSKGFNNQMGTVINNVERFKVVDPYGLGLSLISISVVFGVLILLAIVFTYVGNFFVWREKKTEQKVEEAKKPKVQVIASDELDEAAIAAVVAMYMLDAHDDATGQLTIVQNNNVGHWRFPFRKH